MAEPIAADAEAAVAEPRARPRATSFAGDVLRLMTGTVAGQALAILASPIVTRLFQPDAFGIAALFATITSIIDGVAPLGYELSIMLPKSDEEAANLVGVSMICVALVSTASGLLAMLGRHALLARLHAPGLAPYLWLVPCGVGLAGASRVLTLWSSRHRRYARLSAAQVTNAVVSTGGQLGAGYGGLASEGSLIAARLAGSVASAAALGAQAWRDDGRLFRRSMSWRGMVAGLVRHRKFPTYNIWSRFLASAAWEMPTFLLAIYYSPAVVGFYALSSRLLRLPMALIGEAIAQVFFQRAAEARREGTLASVVEGAFQRLVAFGLFPMLMLTLIGRDLFVVAFGERWAEAGVYTQILSPWMLLWLISSPMIRLFSVLEKQEFDLKFNAGILVARFLAFYVGGRLGDARLALTLAAVVGVLTYGYLNGAIMLAAGATRRSIGRILLPYLALFVPAACMVAALRLARVPSIGVVLTSGTLILGYLAFAAATDPEVSRILKTRLTG